MMVDVVCLRHQGTKLPDDVIAQTTPVRGDLTMVNHRRWSGTGGRYNFVIATLTLVDGALPVTELRHATVTQMRADSFLVAGLEVHIPQPQPGVSFQCDQTWWCRVVDQSQ